MRKANYTQQGLPRELLHEPPERRRRQPADQRRPGQADRVQLRHQHLRLRSVERPDRCGTSTSSATAATCDSTLPAVDCARTPTTATEFGGYVQDEIFLSTMFRWVVGGRVDHFDYLNDFVFSPRTTFMIKPQRGPDVPRLVQPRLSLAVGHQQLPRPDDRPADQPRRCSARRWPADLPAAGRDSGQPGSEGAVARRLRDRLHAASSRSARPSSAAFYVNNLKNDILFTQDRSVALHATESAARAGRCRRP